MDLLGTSIKSRFENMVLFLFSSGSCGFASFDSFNKFGLSFGSSMYSLKFIFTYTFMIHVDMISVYNVYESLKAIGKSLVICAT